MMDAQFRVLVKNKNTTKAFNVQLLKYHKMRFNSEKWIYITSQVSVLQ